MYIRTYIYIADIFIYFLLEEENEKRMKEERKGREGKKRTESRETPPGLNYRVLKT